MSDTLERKGLTGLKVGDRVTVVRHLMWCSPQIYRVEIVSRLLKKYFETDTNGKWAYDGRGYANDRSRPLFVIRHEGWHDQWMADDKEKSALVYEAQELINSIRAMSLPKLRELVKVMKGEE